MIEYAVIYKLPSGWWTTCTTTNLTEAIDVAVREQNRTGWPHKVVPA